MAYDDTEIEIKLELSDVQFQTVLDRLKDIAEQKKESHQIDEYFTPAHKDFLNHQFPFEWFRIGQRSGKTILTYKHFYPENHTPFTHCDEFETEVQCPEKLRKILTAIDMRPLIKVDKLRQSFLYQDKFEITLDTVQECGKYMEIELMKDMGSIEAGMDSIINFAKSLDLDTTQQVNRGYPYILMEKKGLLK